MSHIKVDLESTGLTTRKLSGGQTIGEATAALAAQHSDAHASLVARQASAPLGWMTLPDGGPWLQDCLDIAGELRDNYAELIVCGIGGSALGIQAVFGALDWPVTELENVYVLDNIDPSQLAALAENSELRESAINVISKSGGTLETMSGFFYLLDVLKEHGLEDDEINQRVVATTDPTGGILRPLAVARGWKTLPVPPDVGGRYSVLSPVGIMPLAFAGVDVHALLKGANECQAWLAGLSTSESPAWQLAAAHYLLETQGGVNQTLQYMYGDPLVLLGDWFRQLWAESLGKAKHIDGSDAHVCMTPVIARGSTDQHSQNQLYMEGPDNKLFGIIGCDKWAVDPVLTVPADSVLDSERYYSGKSFGQLLGASRDGNRDALIKNGRPVYEIMFDGITPESVGAYLQFWMLATAYAGDIYKVNAFDQPGVEGSKLLTKARLRGSE